MQKYFNSVADKHGNPVHGAVVAVTTYPVGAAATIYSDNGVTPIVGSLETDANGFFAFYAADGHYTLTITNFGVTVRIIDVLLEDPVDNADALSAKTFGAVADYNGTTGTNNAAAFLALFAAAKVRGGGPIFVPPGNYFFGNRSTSDNVMSVDGLHDVHIIAYGARFFINTTGDASPIWLNLLNCNRVRISGARWFDAGFSQSYWPSNSRRGMGCVSLSATVPCGDISLIDCHMENATYLLVADLSAANQRRNISNVTVRDCSAKSSYYGVDTIYLGDNLHVSNFDCVDVRRGFIGYGTRNAHIDIKLRTTANFLGSNAFISLACEGNAGGYGAENDSENIRVSLTVSGVEAHENYVHLYHQQADSAGSISNVDIDVQVKGLTSVGKNVLLGVANIVKLDHELPDASITATTQRKFQNISISGGVLGTITGLPLVVSSYNATVNHTISMSPNFTRAYQAAPGLAAAVNDLRDKVEWRSPVEFPMWTITPIGTTTPGVVTGLAQKGTVCIQNKRATYNLYLTCSAHTGTGDLRLNGFQKIDTSGSNPANAAVSFASVGLPVTAGTSPFALHGGTADMQVIVYSANGTPVAAGNGFTAWVSGSYLIQ